MGLSVEDERSFQIPTPLLNPKMITTEVYLSKVKMLTPSVKNRVQKEATKVNPSTANKIPTSGTEDVSP